MNPRQAKKFIRIFAAITAAGLIAVSAIVAVIDPFFRYHDPLDAFPYVIDNQLSQNIGMAERFAFDAVITGSSMTMNFDTDDFARCFPDSLRTLKLTMNGAYPHDIRRILEAVYSGKSARTGGIRRVFIALDPATWTAETEEVKYPYPEELYDRNPFNDVRYLWNMRVLLEYCLRPAAEREATPLNRIYMTDWEDDMYYTLDWILSRYEEPAAVPQETPADAYLSGTERNLRENLLPFVEAHPETEFFFFFPPYSVLYWHNAIRENHLEATLSQEQFLAETLLSADNVRVFTFQDMEEIITNIDGGYMDEIHFRPEVNRMMTESFADGTHEITDPEAMRASIGRLRVIIEDCDLDGVLSPR
ncbi:MAG: hypothetical protein K6G16_05995 [Lachnospiraceae bacterium]|nr:hypothetical protein [Lachnospiraceae bacterium]